MRTKLLTVGAVALTTAALAIPVTGLAGATLAPAVSDRLAPLVPEANALETFADCEQLRQWYVARALGEVTAWGLGSVYPMGAYDMVRAAPAATGGLAEAQGSSATGTNTQEAGVDEPDRAKTDGRLVVRLDGHRMVLTDVTGDSPRELGDLVLPRALDGADLLLVGDRVLVVGAAQRWYGGPMVRGMAPDRLMPVRDPQSTRVLTVDVSDPASPTVVSDQHFEGSLVMARQYAGTVRLVLQSGGTGLHFVYPDGGRSETESLAENRRIVRESTIEDWLPSVNGHPFVSCADVRHPASTRGLGTLTVVGLDPAAPDRLHTTAITTGSATAYSSTDRLYLTTGDYDQRNREATTQIHEFRLDGLDAEYAASGGVRGWLKDRWSMDEQDGVLRVVVQRTPEQRPADNELVTLREEGARLVPLGEVDRIAPGEQVMSVRWLGDLAVVVTFEQIDPLFTLDLADPAHPRMLGKLKVPGFSEYLHPIGDGHLLGVGQDADLGGRTNGGQVSVFDLSDTGRPTRLDALRLGQRTSPLAGGETRAFTWLPTRSIAITAVDRGWNGAGALLALHVSPDGRLTLVGQWPTDRWGSSRARALPLADGRVALVTDHVQVVNPGAAK